MPGDILAILSERAIRTLVRFTDRPRVHVVSNASAPWEQGGVAERWRTPFSPIAAPIREASHGDTKNKGGGVEADEGILLTLFQNGQLMGGMLWFFHVRIKYWQKCTYTTD